MIPEDLQQALRSCPVAKRNFEAFNNSTKKTLLTWIGSARRNVTREKRIQKVVGAAAEDRNPLSR
ncbi:MAG: YdeI/OmpD-associated family protein [Synechococcaceae cyanobacterium SM2_3_1]|nr:YdeI/OmpD-associated family protein [Synechococcaceae cyanobacterium SM2_3_1]